jgi:hypothetical protein
MLRVLVCVVSTVGVCGLRRSDYESETSKVQSLLTVHQHSFKAEHLENVRGMLEKSKYSDLTVTLQKVIDDLDNAEAKILKAVETTSNEIKTTVEAYEKAVDNAEAYYHVATETDVTYSDSVAAEKSITERLWARKALRASNLTSRIAAEWDVGNFTLIDETVLVPDVECSNADEDCAADLAQWVSGLNSAIANREQQVTWRISNYTVKNQTWTDAIADYNAVTQQVREIQAEWNVQNLVTNKNKWMRYQSRCSYFTSQNEQCARQNAFDHLIAQEKGDDNIFSQPDRVTEYESVTLAKCLLTSLKNQVEITGDDLKTWCSTQNFNTQIPQQPDLQTDYYEQVKQKLTYACGTAEFKFANNNWQEWYAWFSKVDGELVWEKDPSVEKYVKTEPFLWNEQNSHCLKMLDASVEGDH